MIFSEPRGGSTWLMELLNYIPKSVTNWEPLHKIKGVIPKSYYWGNRVFIPQNVDNENYLNTMKNILTLKMFSKWTLSKNSFNDINKGKIVITKFIQGNMLLPWITNHINFNYKPIYLLRHPISTSLSQIKAFGNDNQSMKKFEIPDGINNQRFEKHLEYINSLETHLQRQVCLWCINNEYVLNFKDHELKWLILYYENLVLKPEKEIKLILKEYKLEYLFEFLNLDKLRDASATNFDLDLKNDPIQQIEKFRNEIEDMELKNIQDILDYFGIKCYSAFSAYPIEK